MLLVQSGAKAWSSPATFLRNDLSSIATRRSALILGGAAALAAASLAIENPGAEERALGRGAIDPPADFGNFYGKGAILALTASGLAGAGLLESNPDWIRAGSEMARSIVYSGAVVTVLKLAVRRTRPNGGPYSFPSGHTALAFAAAPVLARHFGPAVGIPAFALAVSTGLGRMEDRKHYLSDVVFGAGIGTAIGLAIASEHLDANLGEDRAASGSCETEDSSSPRSPKAYLALGVSPSGLGLTARF